MHGYSTRMAIALGNVGNHPLSQHVCIVSVSPAPPHTTGSLTDSVLGSLLQRSWQDVMTGRVTSRLPSLRTVIPPRAVFTADAPGRRASHGTAVLGHYTLADGAGVVTLRECIDPSFTVIAGYDVLSNEAVNFVSVALMAVLFAGVFLRAVNRT